MNWYLEVLKKFATFNGRARRKEYWMFFLFNIIISIVLGVVDGVVFGKELLGNVYSILVLVPGLAVGVRRMHDVGKSGWFILIPIYNIILAATDGDKGDNEYGKDPKENNGLGSDILDSEL